MTTDDYQPYSLWLRTTNGEYVKFALVDNPDGSVNFEMWQEEARLFCLTFPNTAEFVDLTQRLLVIGSNKEKDDSQRAPTVSIGGFGKKE